MTTEQAPTRDWRLVDRYFPDSSLSVPPPIALLGLGIVLVLAWDLAVLAHAGTTMAAVMVIAAVVMAHEAGHFVTAKLSGMKVTEFFIGFGPRLWTVRRGETEYGIKALPLGGYNRIIGMNNLEEVDAADEARTYRAQSFPRRLITVSAGSLVHFTLAVIAGWTLFAFAHEARPVPVVTDFPVLSTGPTPAQRSGLKIGDRIVSYDGHPTHNTWSGVHSYIRSHAGIPINFVVSRGGQLVAVRATPIDAATVTDHGVPLSSVHFGFLGFDSKASNDSLLGAVPHAFSGFWHDGVMGTFRGIGQIFSPSGLSSLGHQVVSGSSSGSSAGTRPASVIGVVQIADQLPGWASKMLLFMEANAFVGVLNLFPILPFDGGHVIIAVYERLRTRRGRRYVADVAKMLPYSMAVVMVIGFVFVSSIYLDIAHPITLH